MSEEWGAAYSISIDKLYSPAVVRPQVWTYDIIHNYGRIKEGAGVLQPLFGQQPPGCCVVNQKGVDIPPSSVLWDGTL